MAIEIEYKGFKIIFHEWHDAWECDEAPVKPNQSLENVKGQIDAHIKKEGSFPRQTALMQGDRWRENESYIETTVTSGCSDDAGSFWVSTGGKRSKQKGKFLYLNCAENHEKISQIESLNTEMRKLKEQREAIASSLTIFTPVK